MVWAARFPAAMPDGRSSMGLVARPFRVHSAGFVRPRTARPPRDDARGGLSSTGRALDCGSRGYGFEPRRPPHPPILTLDPDGPSIRRLARPARSVAAGGSRRAVDVPPARPIDRRTAADRRRKRHIGGRSSRVRRSWTAPAARAVARRSLGSLGGTSTGPADRRAPSRSSILTDPDKRPTYDDLVSDTVHDPGPDASLDRIRDLPPDVAAEPIRLGKDAGSVRIGTASWTDPTMTAAGVFYPDGADSAEERLAYYASQFPLVEVDATYYALPSRRTAELWVERTPPDFTFDVKAHALMTGQPTETKRLPKDLRAALPDGRRGQVAHLREGPARGPARRGLGLVRGRAGAAQGGRPARVDPAPVPALVLHRRRRTATRSRRRSGACAMPA